ncbi:MAG: hypothetical protein J0H42_25580 [Rhizobiales bacterium]|nr:hypothetical protein [Hyphomicrobiales bacterium]
MSATILQFPLRSSLSDMNLDYGFDVSAPDKRGFVLVDACVSVTLAAEFMQLITKYNELKTPACPHAPVRCHDRPEFSFDIAEPVQGGNWLIDACVPQALALEFRDLRARVAIQAA